MVETILHNQIQISINHRYAVILLLSPNNKTTFDKALSRTRQLQEEFTSQEEYIPQKGAIATLVPSNEEDLLDFCLALKSISKNDIVT
mmetsp:Transcript_50957/g.61408  ORF Transcript_50957/g.61408 Transcript_50957/m.61408 type:complete len:88 (-) Transcript_50957:1229-1492(-)